MKKLGTDGAEGLLPAGEVHGNNPFQVVPVADGVSTGESRSVSEFLQGAFGMKSKQEKAEAKERRLGVKFPGEIVTDEHGTRKLIPSGDFGPGSKDRRKSSRRKTSPVGL